MSPTLHILLFCSITVAAISKPATAQERSELALPPNGDNQKAEVSQWIGLVKISIAYHSPNVHGGGGKDRTGHIYGELIKYGFFDDGFGPSTATPWRAGANETTTISFSHDVKIEGKNIKAGTYALFLELEKTGHWQWIFSSNYWGWGSFQYDSTNDVLRVPVDPQTAAYTEFLTYGFDERRPSSAVAFLQWENKRISFKIDVPNVNELYVAQIRKDLQSWPGFNYANWQLAAQFCLANNINLQEALVWAEKAISEPFRNGAQGRADFSTLQTKAQILQALGRTTEADATMDQAMNMQGTPVIPMHQYGITLLNAGRKERALEIFKLNRKHHPDDQFFTFVGLARGYTAVGDKKNAIKSWETALLHVPPAQQRFLPQYEQALNALKDAKSP
jgi:tetratricopeptide (TPR) repeat protein